MNLLDLAFRVGELGFVVGGVVGSVRMMRVQLKAHAEAVDKRIDQALGEFRMSIQGIHDRLNAAAARAQRFAERV